MLLGVFLSSCQQEQTQAQPEQHEQFGQSEEPDAIQTILDQNIQLAEENKRLVAELQNLKAQLPEQQPLKTKPLEQPSLEMPSLITNAASYLPPTSPADAWQQIQEIANTNMVDGEQKTRFLQESSSLIKQWEEAQTAIESQRETILYLETIQGEEPQAIAKLADARQKITALEAIANQAQRDLDTLIAPYRKLQSQPSLALVVYSNLTIDCLITITEGQFIVTIHYTDPNMNWSKDTFNLNLGRGTQTYPPAFTRAIYSLIRKMWRRDIIRWSRPPSGTELVQFVNLVTTVPRTITEESMY